MAQVQLFKKETTYKDKKTGEDKNVTNFYLKCGDKLIPIQITYFPNAENGNKDVQYGSRRAVMSAFAETLPDKQ